MADSRNFKKREIARLQVELASALCRLDELEKRSRLRANVATANVTYDDGAMSVVDSPELRFAACVASGMTKLQVN